MSHLENYECNLILNLLSRYNVIIVFKLYTYSFDEIKYYM